MKKLGILILSGLLLAALVLSISSLNRPSVTAAPPSQGIADDSPQRMIQVNGSGTASVEPNNAVVVVGVRTQAESASDALSQNNEQVNGLIPVLLDAGIAAEDIQTQQISLMPVYSQPDNNDQTDISGYIATNTVQVRIRDIGQVGDVLDTAVQNGGNLIESISFEVSQQDLAVQQAREAAFDNAREKAEQLADLAGVQLGNLISIVEVSGSFPRPFAAGGAADVAQMAVPVQPGSQTIQVDLQVAWAITGGTAGGGVNTPTAFVSPTRTPTVITGVTITPIAATATSVSNTATVAAPTASATDEVIPTVGVTVVATNEPTATETSTGP